MTSMLKLLKKAAVDYMLGLADGTVTMNVEENPLASYVNDLPVELLPCPIPFLNQVQCYKWLE